MYKANFWERKKQSKDLKSLCTLLQTFAEIKENLMDKEEAF